jgi:hypothetical protein
MASSMGEAQSESLRDQQDLTLHVQGIEAHLIDLDAHLRTQNLLAIEEASASLHKALADALVAFRHAQQQGQVPLSAELRGRLMLAQARVTGLQQSVHRASASLQRTLGVLLVQEGPGAAAPATYSAPSGPSAAYARNAV